GFAAFDATTLVDGRKEWATYAPMKDRLRKPQPRPMTAAEPQPAPLIEVTEAELETALAALAFPACDAPVVSIVVPAFNNLRLTAECLLSVQRHTDGSIPYEVILVDDASTDRTHELLSRVPGLAYRRNATNLHFLRSCNAAARMARGEFLLLLNTDVQVTEGWLPPLQAAFRDEPRCGAAGPRILYPGGQLQEAGVRIEPDATATMLGLNDDATLARYGFNRRVDYCSGAALMFRRETWNAIGGFDESLAPAYCEDMEICLRLRDAGWDTWYVADSTVVHHLSRTTAAGGNENKMRMIVANQQKAALRWQPLIDRLHEVR
ncbi:glycosyltransferase family 2 protein, partial [Nostoc sp. NIES-2111]